MNPDLLVGVIDNDPGAVATLTAALKTVGLSPKVWDHVGRERFADWRANEPFTVLVTELRLVSMSGVEILERMRNAGDGRPVIILTRYGDVPSAVAAMKAGAADYLEKGPHLQPVLDAVVRAGEGWRRTRDELQARGDFEAKVSLLTPRERQVMELLTEGKANSDIASQLDISRKTLDIHRAKVLHKMQADNVPHLVRMALNGPCSRR